MAMGRHEARQLHAYPRPETVPRETATEGGPPQKQVVMNWRIVRQRLRELRDQAFPRKTGLAEARAGLESEVEGLLDSVS